jgi:alkanesulfonate monooxygenase SsuD/methylene tetrahydromethanopterin reductase-like flavin-dependent oxidoreductase (luciferase family)
MPAPPDAPLRDPFPALAYAPAVISRIRLATAAMEQFHQQVMARQ